MGRGELALKRAERARAQAPADGSAERLAIEAAQKDPTLFAGLYEDNFDRVYAFVARRVHNRDEAEDLTAEVFHRALKSLPQFEWRGVTFAAWLFKIAVNAIIDRSKHAAREDELADPGDPAGESPETIHERARLFRLVDKLPIDQRRVIVMRFAEDRTTHEIARRLGRSEGAIKQLQFRGLQNLRARLSKANG